MSVGIVGMGYVGIPLALRFHEVGVQVVGFDIDLTKVAELNRGKSYIQHIPDNSIAAMSQDGFVATSDYSKISDVDAILICVPTPLDRFRDPDMSFIISTMEQVSAHLRPGQLLSLESTTYPGTTEELLLPYVRERGLSVGEDFFLVYSPEREDPGNPDFSTRMIPKVVGGATEACLARGVELYKKIIDQVVPVSTTQTAEMVKLLENIHRNVNIGLANEMKIVCERMGVDIYEVINAAATKPFGFKAYYPGPGVGGHCIPIDPFYLTWKAREYGLHTRFIELAGEINQSMPDYVVERIAHALNELGKPIKGSKILALGIAYKKNVDDMRESASVEVMELLREYGADISYSDPHVPEFPAMRKHKFDLSSVDLSADNLAAFDCVVLLTDHDDFDYQMISDHAKLVVDTRGKIALQTGKVVRA